MGFGFPEIGWCGFFTLRWHKAGRLRRRRSVCSHLYSYLSLHCSTLLLRASTNSLPLPSRRVARLTLDFKNVLQPCTRCHRLLAQETNDGDASHVFVVATRICTTFPIVVTICITDLCQVTGNRVYELLRFVSNVLHPALIHHHASSGQTTGVSCLFLPSRARLMTVMVTGKECRNKGASCRSHLNFNNSMLIIQACWGRLLHRFTR